MRTILLLLFIVLFTGCSTRKQTRHTAHCVWRDSLYFTRKDSLSVNHILSLEKITNLHLEHTTYTPPDSTGIQYKLSSTLLSSIIREKAIHEESDTSVTTLKAESKQEVIHTEEKSSRKNRNNPLSLLYGFILLLLFILILYKHRVRKHRRFV